MSIIIPANSAVGGGFEVANSIMLQDSRLFKTPSSSGSQRKFTFSAWIKKSDFSSGVIFSSGEADGNPNFALYFASNDKLNLYSSQGMEYTTNAIFRDSNAWMHIVISINTASSNASNRQLIWVNGVQQTSFSTSNSIAQNTDLSINTSAYRMAVGTGVDNQDYFGGYVAEVVFLDDQALGHLSFGEFDSDSGIWKPIAITGSAATPGTNGFYLNFQDSSNLGNDEFGGTDLSVSDIVATDQKTDTCTNNFATINPLIVMNNDTVYSEGNTILTPGGNKGNWQIGFSSIALSVGKWYVETKMIEGHFVNGISETTSNQLFASGPEHFIGGFTKEIGYYSQTGNKFVENSQSSYGASYTNGDIIGMALDLDSGTRTITFFKNGASQGAITLPTDMELMTFGVSNNQAGSPSAQFNFGNPPFSISSGNADGNGYGNFEYAPPSGHLSLNSKNLSEVLS